MHAKTTYQRNGTIDVDISVQGLTGAEVMRLLLALTNAGHNVTVERLSPSGAPLQEPELRKGKGLK